MQYLSWHSQLDGRPAGRMDGRAAQGAAQVINGRRDGFFFIFLGKYLQLSALMRLCVSESSQKSLQYAG